MTISLITVCHQSVEVNRTAMESVLRQTWPDIEYLVIDGGSTDGTVDVIREYETKFNGRMRWVSERDGGMYDAINKGIRMATGDVVGILNADDVLATDGVLEAVARAFAGDEKNELDAVYGDIRFVADCRDKALDPLRAEKTVRYYSARRWRPWMLQWGVMPPHPSVYIRRGCFEQFGGYALDYTIAADYALLIRFLRKAGLSARYLPLCMVDMRMGGVSTRNWRSNLLLNQEIVRGNREAGYFCCLPMLLPKYAFKIWEFIVPRVRFGSMRPR